MVPPPHRPNLSGVAHVPKSVRILPLAVVACCFLFPPCAFKCTRCFLNVTCFCALLMLALKLLIAAAVVWYCKAQQVLPCTGSLTARALFCSVASPPPPICTDAIRHFRCSSPLVPSRPAHGPCCRHAAIRRLGRPDSGPQSFRVRVLSNVRPPLAWLPALCNVCAWRKLI